MALDVLTRTDGGRRLDVALADARSGIDPGQWGWLQELTYGVVRLRGRVDAVLDHHLHQGLESVEPPELLRILRLGTYQILFMGSVPAYAAVDQAVELAREAVGEGASGFVNGVLRSVARAGLDEELRSELFPSFEEDPAAHLASWGSHPAWLVERWIRRWGSARAAGVVASDNEIPPVFLHAPRVRPEDAVEALARAGIDARPVDVPVPCVRLEGGSRPDDALGAVPGSLIQDPAAALVSRFAAAGAGEVVVDLCAAPGGKSLAMALNGAYVLASDRSRTRLGLVADNARRVGLSAVPGGAGSGGGIALVQALAEAPPVRAARLVLLDVPCTGTGTLRRHPDARWRLRPPDVDRLAAVQRRILEGAAGAVAQGGVMVYATCTLEPEENELQVRSFLERHPDFRVDPGPDELRRFVDEEGFLRVLPDESDFDGAFAARLRRVG